MKEMPFGDIRRLLEYNEDEKKHWDETGNSPDHIYCSMQRILDWLDNPRCWVLVTQYGGLIEPNPKVFWEERLALQARDKADEKFGIKRDKEGNYEHYENNCDLYEIAVCQTPEDLDAPDLGGPQ